MRETHYYGPIGWYEAVQIQANLLGDTNPSQWVAGQAATITGTTQAASTAPGRQVNIFQPKDGPSGFGAFTMRARAGLIGSIYPAYPAKSMRPSLISGLLRISQTI
jgi:hypothetical protein